MQTTPSIESRLFEDDGDTPNNPSLPMVLMRHTAAVTAADPAAWFENHFTNHGWGACWRWGVYPFHHFHSDNHEVLGVCRGTATLQLGGEHGAEFKVATGDVIILPAGTGHQCLVSSADFQVVGAYPNAKKPDMCRSGESDLISLRVQITQVPVPNEDPVFGKDGPLFELWIREADFRPASSATG